jgi:hypothetical protein
MKSSVETMAVVPGRCYFGAYCNIAIGVWVAQANLAAAETLLRVAREMAVRCPGRHSSVGFLLHGLPGPLPEAVPALTKVWEKRPDLACTAIVLEGSGFWASGLRSMLSNTRREGGGNVPSKIGSSIEAVVEWLSAQNELGTGVAIPPEELARALRLARQLGEQLAVAR